MSKTGLYPEVLVGQAHQNELRATNHQMGQATARPQYALIVAVIALGQLGIVLGALLAA